MTKRKRNRWLLGIVPLVLSYQAYALSTSYGVAIVEEGDNTLNTGHSLRILHDDVQLSMFYYNDFFGPVSMHSAVVGANKQFQLGSMPIFAGIGAGILVDYIAIETATFTKHEVEYHAGVFPGLYWRGKWTDRIVWELGWESGLFPAGIVGGIFLATGRRHFLTFAVGVKL